MSIMVDVTLLENYRVDRTAGQTRDGQTELVVLVLKCSGARELAAAMSKADAMIIATQLAQAAGEAQETMFAKA